VLFPNDEQILFIYLFVCVFFVVQWIPHYVHMLLQITSYQFRPPKVFSLHRRIPLDFPHCNRSHYRVTTVLYDSN
jgi:hypothetical protein